MLPPFSLFYSFCVVCTVVATLSDYSKELKLDKLNTILFKSKSKDGEGSKENDERIVENEKIQHSGGLNQILMAFSLKSTSPLLFNADDGSDEDQVGCIHGIKAIGTIMLFIALRAIPLGRMPFDNRNEMTDLLNQPISVLVRGMFLYTDLFLFLSGLLCSYGVVKDIKSNGKLFIVRRTIGRIVRLVPTLLAVLLFYAYIWEYIGSMLCLSPIDAQLTITHFHFLALFLLPSFFGFQMAHNGVIWSSRIQSCARRVCGKIFYSSKTGCRLRASVPLTRSSWPSICSSMC